MFVLLSGIVFCFFSVYCSLKTAIDRHSFRFHLKNGEINFRIFWRRWNKPTTKSWITKPLHSKFIIKNIKAKTVLAFIKSDQKKISTCWTVGVVASLMMGAPADGVVANGESNGEPELLEWLSVDCWVYEYVYVMCCVVLSRRIKPKWAKWNRLKERKKKRS